MGLADTLLGFGRKCGSSSVEVHQGMTFQVGISLDLAMSPAGKITFVSYLFFFSDEVFVL